ncbi:hypothetical protein VTN77DRAFT_2064 [Rasamsonia byssochlamydoides]|uniref:uncharacterized protein n=1 Tax=Rasamsonia byssochlamydoides TaxID=89139 RepID=UPI003741EB7C
MPRRFAIYDSTDESSAQSSESENTPPKIPSDARLEKALRDTVANMFRTGNLEEVTVRRVRLATEKALGLEEGFFKGDARWKEKSDRIIKEEAEAHMKAREEEEEVEEETSDDEPIPPQKPVKQEKPTKSTKPAKPIKRSPTEDSPKPKKRRKTEESEEESSVPPTDEEVPKPAKRASASPKKESKPESATKIMSEESDVADKGQAAQTEADQEASESEMSVVLDEPPKPQQKRQKSADAPTKKGKRKGAVKVDPNLDPDQAEIKRLQGWLVKCGIRKMWSRELAPYDTAKAKIKHLKKMLEDAGMKGRYSLEKARQIRERRELQADLELVQEGARRWGTGSAGEESDNEGRPRKRLARGLKSLAFLGEDGEETD